MTRDQFIHALEAAPSEFAFTELTNHSIAVRDKVFNVFVTFTPAQIEHNEWSRLLAAMHGGKNVEQITRVTGYFSKVHQWNNGKRGELRDRFRSDLEGNPQGTR